MSSSPPVSRNALRWTALLPRLRVMLVIAGVGAAVGFGAYSAMNRKVEIIDDSELEGINELAADEFPDAGELRGRARPLASATITDVIAAGHSENSDERSRVQMAGHVNNARPESNSAVWLIGTIEDSTPASTDTEPSSAPAPFRRFSR